MCGSQLKCNDFNNLSVNRANLSCVRCVIPRETGRWDAHCTCVSSAGTLSRVANTALDPLQLTCSMLQTVELISCHDKHAIILPDRCVKNWCIYTLAHL
eukprot:SAG31_NODE_3185_length_4579_cov_2.704911_2_plen_99_part_00